jgi:hypothetical protein
MDKFSYEQLFFCILNMNSELVKVQRSDCVLVLLFLILCLKLFKMWFVLSKFNVSILAQNILAIVPAEPINASNAHNPHIREGLSGPGTPGSQRWRWWDRHVSQIRPKLNFNARFRGWYNLWRWLRRCTPTSCVYWLPADSDNYSKRPAGACK